MDQLTKYVDYRNQGNTEIHDESVYNDLLKWKSNETVVYLNYFEKCSSQEYEISRCSYSPQRKSCMIVCRFNHLNELCWLSWFQTDRVTTTILLIRYLSVNGNDIKSNHNEWVLHQTSIKRLIYMDISEESSQWTSRITSTTNMVKRVSLSSMFALLTHYISLLVNYFH